MKGEICILYENFLKYGLKVKVKNSELLVSNKRYPTWSKPLNMSMEADKACGLLLRYAMER